jgi:hypothetical protein
MLSHIRRFSIFAITALALSACGDDPDPTTVVIGLPTALSPISVSTAKNTTVQATVLVSSIDGRTLTYSVTSGPSNGAAQLTEIASGVRVSYTPTTGFAGSDQVTFRVSDGVSTVDGEVNITVTNVAPSVTSVSMRRPAFGPIDIDVSGSDADGDALTFEVVGVPANGSLSGFTATAPPAGVSAAQGVPATTNARITYTPNEGYIGNETFTYRATDGNAPSPPATVSLTANRVPQGTIVGGGPAVVRRNAPTRISIGITDADADPVTNTIGAAPSHGTVGAIEATRSGVRVLYTPAPGFAGDDSFSLLLDDGYDAVPFVIDVTVVNEAPVAFNAATTGFVGSDVAINLTAADPDGDPLTFEVVTGPAVGTVGTINSTGPASARVVYSPGAATAGPQSFTYRVSDGIDFSPAATVVVQLITEAPLAVATNVTTPEDTPVMITLTGIDQQGDALSFAIATAPLHGTLGAITSLGQFTASVTYTPDPNYTGADFFQFTVSDGTNTSGPGDVGVTMIPADDPPIVVGSPIETFTTHTNVTLEFAASASITPGVFVSGNLLSNFLDPDLDGLTISLVGGTVTAGASVTINADGTFTYVPPVGRTADDTFDYSVTDGTTPVTRTVTVSFGPAIWFVDDTFVGASTGTSSAPFTTVGAAAGASAPGDIVFVRRGNSGTTPLAGGFAFQAGQQLVGEAAGLTTSLGAIVAPSGGGRPVLTNAGGAAVTLADGASVTGFDISAPSGAGVLASGVTDGTLSGVTITNTGGPGIDISTSSGTFDLSSVTVLNTGTGAGVVLSGNPGATIDFTGGGLDIDVTSGAGFAATGGGTVTVQGAGNSVLSTTGTAVNIASTTIGAAGVSFLRVDADGATNGIVVDNTGAGAFSVTGTATTGGSGGTITNTTGDGVVLNATGPVSLANMIIGDPAASAGQAPDASNLIAGDGISATDVTGAPGLTLNNVLVSRTADHGIDGTRVTGLTLTNSSFLNNGDGAGDDALHFGASGGPDGLFGTATIGNTVVDGFARAGLAVHNATGALSLTVSGGTFANNQTGIAAGVGTQGIWLSPAGTASITASVTGTSSFSGLLGEGVSGTPSGTASLDLTVTGGSFNGTQSGGGAISVTGGGTSSTRVGVTNNTILNAAGSAIFLVESAGSTLDATVTNNTVGTLGSPGSGAQAGNGISLIHAGTGLSRFLADGNALNSHDAAGIFSLNLETGVSAGVDSHVILTNNTVAAPENAAPLGGIQMSTSGDHELCTQVTGNTSAGSAGATGIEVQQAGASIFQLRSSSAGTVDVVLAADNTSTAATLGGTFAAVAAGSCATPTAPSTP